MLLTDSSLCMDYKYCGNFSGVPVGNDQRCTYASLAPRFKQRRQTLTFAFDSLRLPNGLLTSFKYFVVTAAGVVRNPNHLFSGGRHDETHVQLLVLCFQQRILGNVFCYPGEKKTPKRSQTHHYFHSVLRNGGKSGLNIIFKLLFKWKSELHFWVLFSSFFLESLSKLFSGSWHVWGFMRCVYFCLNIWEFCADPH